VCLRLGSIEEYDGISDGITIMSSPIAGTLYSAPS